PDPLRGDLRAVSVEEVVVGPGVRHGVLSEHVAPPLAAVAPHVHHALDRRRLGLLSPVLRPLEVQVRAAGAGPDRVGLDRAPAAQLEGHPFAEILAADPRAVGVMEVRPVGAAQVPVLLGDVQVDDQQPGRLAGDTDVGVRVDLRPEVDDHVDVVGGRLSPAVEVPGLVPVPGGRVRHLVTGLHREDVEPARLRLQGVLEHGHLNGSWSGLTKRALSWNSGSSRNFGGMGPWYQRSSTVNGSGLSWPSAARYWISNFRPPNPLKPTSRAVRPVFLPIR